MPPRQYVVNLCSDRYRFTVALAAALMRDQVTLMPPSDAAGVLNSIAAEFAGLYAIHDGTAPTAAIPLLTYPDVLSTGPAPTNPLAFSTNQPAVILFTSGSTGRPTPHLKTWGSLVRSSLAAGAALGLARIPKATIIATVPQQHSYGLEIYRDAGAAAHFAYCTMRVHSTRRMSPLASRPLRRREFWSRRQSTCARCSPILASRRRSTWS